MQPWQSFETVLLEREEAVARITLNRPDRLNAMNQAMFRDLAAAVAAVAAEPGVRALIVTGAGRAFCAGRDMQELREMAEERPVGIPGPASHQTDVLRQLEIPVVAAVNGVAIGVGLNLVVMADFRVATETARFVDGHVKAGLTASATCWYLPRIIGLAKALEVLMAGAPLDAAEALRCGLVSQVVAPEALPDAALALARHLADLPALNTRLAKRSTLLGLATGLDPVLSWAGTMQQYARSTTREQAEAAQKWLAARGKPRSAE